jgi:glycosyltransferase involved in cell wall biosynthesis
LIEWARRLSVRTLTVNRGFIKRCKDANLIFCKTMSALNSIPPDYRSKAIVFTDVAVKMIDASMYVSEKHNPEGFTSYLAVGRLDAWRGFDLLLEAFSQAVRVNTNIRLEILGKGTDKKRLQDIIEKNQLKSFVFLLGQVSMEEYYQKMATCDVVVNPSLKEGAVTMAFDSMSFGKPLICIETGGYTRFFKNDYAVIIPRTSRQEVIEDLANGIIQLTNYEERKRKGEKAHSAGREFSWQHKGELILREIRQRHFECQSRSTTVL